MATELSFEKLVGVSKVDKRQRVFQSERRTLAKPREHKGTGSTEELTDGSAWRKL